MTVDLEVAHGRRRAKFVFTNTDLHRALNLPPDVRITFVHTTIDPGRIHVVIEGDGVPAVPVFHADGVQPGPGYDELAWTGDGEAPILRYVDFLERAGSDRTR